jgi:MFS family permease
VVILTLVFAASMAGLALIHNFVALNLVLLLAGVGWLTINSFLNVAAQTSTPRWVQARVLGVYLLVSQGGLAGGSAVWGLVAERFDERTALLAAAVLLLLGLVTVRRWPLRSGEELDLRPSQHWPDPELALALEASDGPVLVTVEYRVALPNQAAFYQALAALEIIRRRDGARRWGLFRDVADLERLLETFVVASWAEHMRQHERVTVTDRAVEERALALQKPGTTPIVAHLIAPPGVARTSRFRWRAR